MASWAAAQQPAAAAPAGHAVTLLAPHPNGDPKRVAVCVLCGSGRNSGTMATRLHLIRHGATTLSAEDCFAGAVDVPLSDEGRDQARRLGERLATTQLSALYASPLSRTVETARLVGAPQNLVPSLEAGLREIAHGHWEGLRRQEVEEGFASEYEAWEADPFTFAPPDGETGLAVMARALPVIREIVLRHPEQNVAVISHKATIRLLLCSLLGIDARGYRDRLDQAPACLNIVDFKGPVRARLMLYNDTSHYAQEARRTAGQLSKWWDDSGKSPGQR